MYGNKLAAAIKVNGKVLREFKDTVYIPFASEYTILLKNINTVKVIANVFIDGENAVPGGLVINPGQEIDLERWIKNGNLFEGNKFKFIERTGAIEQHRGIKLEDGLIRVEYQFEKILPPINWGDFKTFNDNLPKWPSTTYTTNSVLRSTSASSAVPQGSITCSASMNNVSMDSMIVSQSFANETGITVPGAKSDQKFSIASWFPTETEKHNLVFKLVGDLGDNKPVEKPVTVKHKPKCVTCGKQNKAHAKFCTECGTALEIFA